MTLAKGDRLYKVAGEPYEVLKRVRDWTMQPGHVWDEDALRGILLGREEAHTAFEVLEPGQYAVEELPTGLSPVVLVSTPVVEGVKLKVRS